MICRTNVTLTRWAWWLDELIALESVWMSRMWLCKLEGPLWHSFYSTWDSQRLEVQIFSSKAMDSLHSPASPHKSAESFSMYFHMSQAGLWRDKMFQWKENRRLWMITVPPYLGFEQERSGRVGHCKPLWQEKETLKLKTIKLETGTFKPGRSFSLLPAR